jgi:hypothetical protein
LPGGRRYADFITFKFKEMTKESEQLTDTQKLAIIETAEAMIAEHFTPKPGWNWPPTSAKHMVFTMESPDCEGDIEVYVFIKRVESDDDAD